MTTVVLPHRSGPGAGAEEPLALAERAVEVVQADPARAALLAERALRDRPGAEVVAVATRALGLAARERGDLATAQRLLRRAVAVAERGRLPARAGQARMSLALALATGGRTAAALAEADRAAEVLTGADAARLQVQRALVLQRLGRHDEALDGYRRALGGLARSGDLLWEARLRSNRGALQVYRGALGAAEADLARAEELAAQLGQDLLLAHVRHNRGFLAARQGDVPAALRHYARAERHYRDHGGPLAMLLVDRCELLTAARVLDEAVAAGREAVALLAAAGAGADLAEGRVLLAGAALLAGDPAEAAREAGRAAAELGRQRRPVWAHLARSVEVRARAAAGERGPALLAAARRCADGLGAAGLAADAAHARLVAGTVALDLGRRADAQHQLQLAAAVRHRGPAEVRARGWHACALLRLAAGDRRGALAALAAGLRVLDDARDALGAGELRARAAGAADEMARLGLRLALASGRPRRLLAWSERSRAGALRRPPARRADDAALADDLAALRAAVTDLEAEALAGGSTAETRARAARLERTVTARVRQASGVAGPRSEEARLADVLPLLGDRALVELVRCDDELWALVATPRRVALRPLPAAAAAEQQLTALRFALRRLATGHGSAASLGVVGAAAARAAARLDALLLAPLAPLLADRPLVVVPTGELHALPWALLPSLRGRSVTVAPSALVWGRAVRTAGPGAGSPVLVAGPGLRHAEDEVAELAAELPGARVLVGGQARVREVLTALEGAPLAHVAAHGVFRADNPQFSSLGLADGPLTVHDLEALREPPGVLVLSACDSGLPAVHPGDELMGLVAALLGLGTATVVASVAPVDDAATRVLMGRLHAGLRAGLGPAAALAGAQVALVEEGTLPVEAVGAFACFGAG